MKLIGRLLLYVLIACLVVIFGFYFLLQTRWGADHISNWVSENSGYHLTFDVMDHRFSAPSHLLLENVTFGRDGQPATLVAKTVDIGLSIRQLTAPLHVDTILLQDGTLNISVQTAPFSFEADRLQLRNMALNSPGSEWRLSAQRVNGGVMPWRPEAGRVLG
ncbi:AsmA family protein, partial [Salmonella enterica]|nr:AsmA family protein [Salmonella enterica]